MLGLQHIFSTQSLRDPILAIVEQAVQGEKLQTGRRGMDFWEILVLGVVRLGLNTNYDRLEDLSNNHRSLRGILGVEVADGYGLGKVYRLQTLKDNVGLLDEDSLMRINELVVAHGRQLIKKKKPKQIKRL
ncbi:MAG: hypothetical protein AAF399_13510 [Bacteroidota bacterium]